MADIAAYKKLHPPKPVLDKDSGKPHQGIYVPRHPEKVVGGQIVYRSGWELAFARWCDDNPGVIEWGGEPVAIQYRNPSAINFEECRKVGADPMNPLNWPINNYYPDFYLKIRDDDAESGERRLLIEIKPFYQTERPIPPPSTAKLNEQKRYVNSAKTYATNKQKWDSAIKWCNLHGFEFKVYTEITLQKLGII